MWECFWVCVGLLWSSCNLTIPFPHFPQPFPCSPSAGIRFHFVFAFPSSASGKTERAIMQQTFPFHTQLGLGIRFGLWSPVSMFHVLLAAGLNRRTRGVYEIKMHSAEKLVFSFLTNFEWFLKASDECQPIESESADEALKSHPKQDTFTKSRAHPCCFCKKKKLLMRRTF